jgi:hypothetical protein
MKTYFYIYDYADYVFDIANKIYGASYAEKETSAKITVINGTGQIICYAKVDYREKTVEIVVGSTSEIMPYGDLTLYTLSTLMVDKYLEVQ